MEAIKASKWVRWRNLSLRLLALKTQRNYYGTISALVFLRCFIRIGQLTFLGNRRLGSAKGLTDKREGFARTLGWSQRFINVDGDAAFLVFDQSLIRYCCQIVVRYEYNFDLSCDREHFSEIVIIL